jgi:hypothetical protein
VVPRRPHLGERGLEEERRERERQGEREGRQEGERERARETERGGRGERQGEGERERGDQLPWQPPPLSRTRQKAFLALSACVASTARSTQPAAASTASTECVEMAVSFTGASLSES